MTLTFARRRRLAARRLGGERGTALLEMALTLPLLLLVAVGIFEFGRAFQTWEVLTNAAREGARLAVLPSSTPADTEARARAYLTSGSLNGASATVTVTATMIPIGLGTASASLVKIDYPFQFIVLQPVASLIVHGTAVGSPIVMSASAEMRNESPF